MPRLNIEDSLFKDPRWYKLLIRCGDQYKALGMVATAWILAQKHWIEHGSIPEKAWEDELNILIDTELALRHADGSVYMKGSKKAFKWLEQRVDAGRKGGNERAKRSQATASDRIAKPSKAKQSQASSSSSSSSVVITEKEMSEKIIIFVAWWNIVAEQVRIIKIHDSPDNRYLIAKNIAENPDMEYWKMALNGIYISEFHQGANKSGAKMNIGWFFKPRTASSLVDHYVTNKDLFEGIIP